MSETLELIEKARVFVSDICHGTREWVMHVPADRENDPDLVIAAALRAARIDIEAVPALHSRVAQLEAENAEQEKQIREALGDDWNEADDSVVDLVRHLREQAEESIAENYAVCELRGRANVAEAKLAELRGEVGRLTELDRLRHGECAECECALVRITAHEHPPHCEGCSVSDESYEAWHDAMEKLEAPTHKEPTR